MGLYYEKDYLMRLMQNFFQALGRILLAKNSKDSQLVNAEIQLTFNEFLKNDIDFFENLTLQECVEYFKNDAYPLAKEEILAMLLFEAGMVTPDKELMKRRLMLSNNLINHIAEIQKSLSFDHMNKQQQIRKMLEE